MNKFVFCTALLCSFLLPTLQTYSIEQVSTERVEQHKKHIESRIFATRIARIVAVAGLIGTGAYIFAQPAPTRLVSGPLTPEEAYHLRALLAGEQAKVNASANSGWLSWGASLVKSGFYSGVNLLSFLTLNVVGSELIPYVQSGVSALLRYPGSALRFYTVHARIPEILKEYNHYAKVLDKEQMYDIEDVDYAYLYFLNEYDEIVYRVEKLLAYIGLMGEKYFDMEQDSHVLIEQLTRKTDQLAKSLYRCGAGNSSTNIVEMIKDFEIELTTAIRLCAKIF